MKYLTQNDMNKLINMLMLEAPVETGTLRNNGIQAISFNDDGFVICVGVDSDFQGRNPSKYAWYTEYKNKSSKGWINRVVTKWANNTESVVNTDLESEW